MQQGGWRYLSKAAKRTFAVQRAKEINCRYNHFLVHINVSITIYIISVIIYLEGEGHPKVVDIVSKGLVVLYGTLGVMCLGSLPIPKNFRLAESPSQEMDITFKLFISSASSTSQTIG